MGFEVLPAECTKKAECQKPDDHSDLKKFKEKSPTSAVPVRVETLID